MEKDNIGRTLSEYLGPAVPKIFSETVATLEAFELKLRRGGDLHSKDIETLRSLFHEESLDAKSLRQLVGRKASLFVGDWNDKATMAETVLADITGASEVTCGRVTGVLDRTSMGSAFFTTTLMYLEEYESRHGKAKKPGIDESVLFQLIAEDFARAKAAYVSINESAWEAIAPIQGEIAFFAGRWDADKVSWLAIERALLVGKVRSESRPILETIESDFEKLKARAAKHGYKLSFAWD